MWTTHFLVDAKPRKMMYQQRMINIVDTQFCFIFADRQMWCLSTQYFPSHVQFDLWPVFLFSVSWAKSLIQLCFLWAVITIAPAEMAEQLPFSWRGLRDCILRMTQREIFPWCWMHYAGPHLNLWQEIELKWANWKAAFPCPLSSFNRRERTSLDCCVHCRHWGPTLQLLHAIGGVISFFLSHALTRFAPSPNTICPTGLSMSLLTHPVRCHSTRSVATAWAAPRGVSMEDNLFFVGIAGQLFQILQGECGHTSTIGCGPVARDLWLYALNF